MLDRKPGGSIVKYCALFLFWIYGKTKQGKGGGGLQPRY